MKSSTLPPVRVDAELRAALESVLGESETISTFVEGAVRRAVEHRRVEADFHARGEQAWQRYLSTGVAHNAHEVFEPLRQALAAKRAKLPSKPR